MKNAKARVYIEFVNYLGVVTEREQIAEFRSEEWADDFLKGHGFDPIDGTRLVKEVITKGV